MNPMFVPVIGEVINGVGQMADDLFTSDEERAKATTEGYRAETDRMQGQIEINKLEAASTDKFVTRGRPAVIWVCVAALAYQYLAYPMLTWCWAAMQAAGWISIGLMPPPALEIELLMALIFALLGVGTMRSYDKQKGTAR